ncbi:MAG: helix-turn-helix domain-containing protein [Oscillospiraceae bacterium]|nr:helix-turn-helix domain-containing protein [Oscillospiraceae bacterium]
MSKKYQRIRDLREDSDLSQEAIAKHLSCDRRAYCYYELGQRDIPIDVLERLADFYNTSIDYLLERTDETTPYAKKK